MADAAILSVALVLSIGGLVFLRLMSNGREIALMELKIARARQAMEPALSDIADEDLPVV